MFLCSNDSRINPHMRAKFGCSQRVVSKKGRYRHTETQTHRHTDTQTHRHTDTHTKGHCSFIIVDGLAFISGMLILLSLNRPGAYQIVHLFFINNQTFFFRETEEIAGFLHTLVITTGEPLSNDHPHQRPSLLHDHISCEDSPTVSSVCAIPDRRPSTYNRASDVPRMYVSHVLDRKLLERLMSPSQKIAGYVRVRILMNR